MPEVSPLMRSSPMNNSATVFDVQAERNED